MGNTGGKDRERRERSIESPPPISIDISRSDIPRWIPRLWLWRIEQDDHKRHYDVALKLGEVLVAYGRVMFIGPGGVGKSSLLRGLMNLPLPREAESTIFADTMKLKPMWVQAGTSGRSFWSKVTEDDEFRELAGLIRVVAQLKTSPSIQSRIASLLPSLAAAVAVKLFQPGTSSVKDQKEVDPEYREHIIEVAQEILSRAYRLAESSSEIIAPMSEVFLHVWDCGGQPIYLDALSAFLTSRTMYLLLFDARQNLQSNCTAVCYRRGEVVSRLDHGMTTLQLLLQWMASIHATLHHPLGTPEGQRVRGAKGQGDGGTGAQSESQFVHPEFPRILPVGTHGDDHDVAERKEEILGELASHCSKNPFSQLLRPAIIVNNTTAGGGENEDKAINDIREEVLKFTKSNLVVPTPVAWVLFRKVFQKATRSQPVVTYDEAVAIGEACTIPNDVIPSVLHFYHELGVFLHYTSIEKLREIIITDPQWLINQFGKLLMLEGFEKSGLNDHFWSLLRTKGILVQPLYEEVWRGCEVPAQALVDLLETFRIAAQISTKSQIHHYPGKEYFVPCMLPAQQQQVPTGRAHPCVKRAAPLYLTFSTHYVPPGFFTRLASALSKDQMCSVVFDRGIFRNQITFAYGSEESGRIDEISITEHPVSIQIDIVRILYRGSTNSPMFGHTCRKALKLIQTCSLDVHCWFTSIRIDAAFKCMQCKDSTEHFICIPGGATTLTRFRCNKNNLYEASHEEQYWLKIPQQGPAVDIPVSKEELDFIAEAVIAHQKVEELAKILEVFPQIQSAEVTDAKEMLHYWIDYKPSGTHLRSHLAQYLRVIGLQPTASRFERGRKLTSEHTSHSQHNPTTPLNDTELIVCARNIENVSFLATVLGADDEHLQTIKSKHKSPQGQAVQLLNHWHSTHQTAGNREELTQLLQAAGFSDAARILKTSGKPSLRDLLLHVKVTEWYHLGVELDIEYHILQDIQADTRGDCNASRQQMFEKWLRSSNTPTWRVIIEALNAIGEQTVAKELQDKFCNILSK